MGVHVDHLTKAAYIFFFIDLLLLVGGVFVVLYLIIKWTVLGKLESDLNHLLLSGKHTEAEEIAKELILSNRKYKKYYGYNTLSLIELKRKHFDNAEKYALQATIVFPGDPNSYTTLIDVYLHKRQVYKGLYYVLQAASNAYLDLDLCIAAGKLYLYSDNYDEAIKMFEIAAERDPNSPVPTISIAIAYYLSKNNKKAIDYVRMARKNINPENSFDIEVNEWAKGLLAGMSGDFREASYIFEYYKDVSSYGPIFEKVLERLTPVKSAH